MPAAGRFIPQLILCSNSWLDLQQFGDDTTGLFRYITSLPDPEAGNDDRLCRLRLSGLPRRIYDGLVHSLQLFAAADAAAAATAASAAAQTETGSLRVLFHLGACACYCVMTIPAPAEPGGSAMMTELVNSGERLLCQSALHPVPVQLSLTRVSTCLMLFAL
jgi:hypothetical protein